MMLGATSRREVRGKKEMTPTQPKVDAMQTLKRAMHTLRRVVHAVITTLMLRAGCQKLQIRSTFDLLDAALLLWSK